MEDLTSFLQYRGGSIYEIDVVRDFLTETIDEGLLLRSSGKFLSALGFTAAEISRAASRPPLALQRSEGGVEYHPFGDLDLKFGILFGGRSGSTYLCRLMETFPGVGKLGEYLNHPQLIAHCKETGCRTLPRALDELVKKHATTAGVFGFKGSFQAIVRLTQAGEIPSKVHGWKWIYLRREDIVAQAVSKRLAAHSKVFHRYSDTAPTNDTPDELYSFDEIDKAVDIILRHNAAYEKMFKALGVDVLKIVYERLLDDLPGQMRKIWGFLGFPGEAVYDESAVSIRQLFNDTNRRWIDRYRADWLTMADGREDERRRAVRSAS